MSVSDERWLTERLAAAGAVAGTVHRRAGAVLRLSAAVGIPPAVVEATREIPPGKGMAGLAWSRGVPVATCDLVDDESGDVRPGAKAVGAGQAVAVPVFGADGLRAVVGFAFAAAGEPDEALLAGLTRLAAGLPVAAGGR